jgi:hypothetical protein
LFNFFFIIDFNARARMPCKTDENGFVYVRYGMPIRISAVAMILLSIGGIIISLFYETSIYSIYRVAAFVLFLVFAAGLLLQKYQLTDTALVYGILNKKVLPLDRLRQAAARNPPYVAKGDMCVVFTDRGKKVIQFVLFDGGLSFMSEIGEALGVKVLRQNVREIPDIKRSILVILWAALCIFLLFYGVDFNS